MPCESQTLPLSTFLESPETWEGSNITLRGFLYQKEGKNILTLEPNIPSCCLEKKPFITLHGNSPPHSISSKIVLVQGQMVKDSSGWIMHSASIVEESFSFKEPLIFFCFLILLSWVVAKFWKPLKIYFKNRFG